MALIDQWLDRFDYCERHSIEIRAQPGDVYRALRSIDLADSPLIRFLFRLRGLPVKNAALPMEQFLSNFTVLEDLPGEGLAVGAVGRFWRPSGGSVAVPAAGFRACGEPGVAKLVLAFWTEPAGAALTRLATETRVACTDAAARRRFRVYWYLIRPASGLIRREMLRLTKRAAELG